MACGPRTYNLRNRALDVRLHTPSLLLPLPHYVFRKKRGGIGLPKKRTEKKPQDGLYPRLYIAHYIAQMDLTSGFGNISFKETKPTKLSQITDQNLRKEANAKCAVSVHAKRVSNS